MTIITSDVVKVTVQGISGEIEAKIDTGASQTSMHADEIQISGDDVIFKLNGRTYRAPLETEQDVSSSDGGTQSRPVIRTTIEIEGNSVETLVNLNDRGEMPQQLLIGQDVIRGAELTLQLTNEPDSGSDPVDAGAPDGAIDPTTGGQTPEIYSNVDQPQVETPGGAVDVDLVKSVLRLSAGLNEIQKELLDLIDLINNRNSAK